MKNAMNYKCAVVLIGTISALAFGVYTMCRNIKAWKSCCMESETDSDVSDTLVKPSCDCKRSAILSNVGSTSSTPHLDVQEAAEPSDDPSPAETSTTQTNLPASPVDMDSDLYSTSPRKEDQTE